jgi:hypothetical protein
MGKEKIIRNSTWRNWKLEKKKVGKEEGVRGMWIVKGKSYKKKPTYTFSKFSWKKPSNGKDEWMQEIEQTLKGEECQEK